MAKALQKDPVAAADWLSRAAVKGMPEAALEYGVLVMRGEGVQRDEKIGVKWLLYAANRGHPVAQNRLARIYAAGLGVQADPVEAAKWNLLATKGGRPDATLDELMTKLTPDQKNRPNNRPLHSRLPKPLPPTDNHPAIPALVFGHQALLSRQPHFKD